ncbi:MAG: hypothetical protein WC955_00155 [Elusimicrobiota bacterium]
MNTLTIDRQINTGVECVKLDAKGKHYTVLNQELRKAVANGAKNIEIYNVHGQRYIGTNLYPYDVANLHIKVFGTPGNDLGVFLNGPKIEVFGNTQDAVGNTMNAGEIVVHGNTGDILGYGMRGGEIYVKGNVGYRVAIHMKQFRDKVPAVVIGGAMQDFFGEYMAGGIVVLLALEMPEDHRHSSFVGTGMHGGKIFIRGNMESEQIGKEVGVTEPTEDEYRVINKYVSKYCAYFGNYQPEDIMKDKFIKLYPKILRPYGNIYAY